MLRHYIERRSYTKALDFLEGRDESGAPTVKNEMRRAFYLIIAQIPRGKVATYGQIAELAGYPGRARQVGYAPALVCPKR